MSTASNDGRKIGDRVGIDHDNPKYGGVWIIQSRGPANSVLKREGDVGRALRVPHGMLTDPPRPGAVPGSTVQEIPVATYFEVGEFVRIPDGRYAGLYVVIKDSGTDKVNVAKPGGDDGGYIRAVRRNLVRVNAAEVLK